MKNRFLSVVLPVAIALVAMATPAFAKTYTPTQFRAELKKKIGTKKSTAAATAAAALLNVALGDKKNKKNAVAYVTAVVAALKKAVPTNKQGDSVNRQVKALTVGYFKGLKFNLNDSKYTSALKKLLASLPASQRTQPVSQKIYGTIKTVASSYKVSAGVVYDYYNSVKPGNYPTPVS